MAEYSGFFNSTTSNQRKYSADDFTMMCLAIAGNGVAPSTALNDQDSNTITGAQIIASQPDTAEVQLMGSNLRASIDSNKIKVEAGYSIAHGHWYSNSGTVTLTPPNNGQYQWHVVCVYVDTVLKQAYLAIKSSTASQVEGTARSNFDNTEFSNILPLGAFYTNNGTPVSSSFVDCRKPNTYRYPTMPTDDLPENIVFDVPAVGVSNKYARADHVHKFPNPIATAGGTPSVSGIGTSASYGISTALARADHRHNITEYVGMAKPLADSGTGAAGTTTKFAREDHRHPLNALSSGGDNGTASTYARSDHKHDISSLSQTSSYAFKSQAGFKIYKANSSFTDNDLIGAVVPFTSDLGYPAVGVMLKDNHTGIITSPGEIDLYTNRPSSGIISGLSLLEGNAPMFTSNPRSWVGYLDASVVIAEHAGLQVRAYYDGRIHVIGSVFLDIAGTYSQSGSMYYSPAHTITFPTNLNTPRYYNKLKADFTGRKWNGTITTGQTYSPIAYGILGVCDVNLANSGSVSIRVTSTKDRVEATQDLAFSVDLWGYSEYWT